jgi:hypothetical protein
VGKKGVVDADGKPNSEPVKEELFTIDRPRSRYGAGWTIRSASNLLYLRPEVPSPPVSLILLVRLCAP